MVLGRTRDILGPWAELFQEAGHEPLTQGRPETPGRIADHAIDDVAEFFTGTTSTLPAKPILVGHPFGE
jgi:hypothetical protein